MTANERAIQRMLSTALTIRENLAGRSLKEADYFQAFFLDKIEFELAEHMDDVRRACALLRVRPDDNGRALLAYAGKLVRHYDDADKSAAVVLERAAQKR